jgi:hypothetical protein
MPQFTPEAGRLTVSISECGFGANGIANRKRSPFAKPSVQSVRFRAICAIQASVGFGEQPAKCTLRVATFITNRT